jgi:hypothetical protein
MQHFELRETSLLKKLRRLSMFLAIHRAAAGAHHAKRFTSARHPTPHTRRKQAEVL